MTVLVNRAKMTTATTGTGTITLGSAVAGYQSFADAGVTNGQVVRYVIEDGVNWEIGTGTYTSSGTTLSRTVNESSNADAAISLSGTAQVYITAVAADILQPDNNLSDLASASTARTNLGLGTIATQAANNVSITGGSITGITDLAVADGGTGASDAATARTNLGLAIGTNVQAYDAGLQSISGLTTAADRMIFTTAADTYAVTTLTAAGRAILDDADAAAQRTTLGLGSLATLSTINNSNWSGTDLSVANGGTGASSFTANNVLVGNGTSAFQVVAPGTSGNVLTSNGTTWTSAAVNSLSTASGSAPSYSARSWVRFGGATPTIASSGNVSSITDIAVGRFGVNFTTAMPNSNYATAGAGRRLDAINDCNFSLNQSGATYSTTRVDVAFTDCSNGVLLDPSIGCVLTFV